jgi:hypothetical protein
MQPASTTIMTPASGPSNKLAQITSALFLDAAQAATMKADPLAILTIDEDIAEYHQELKLIINLQKEVKVIYTNNTDYTQHVVSLEDNLKTTNKTIRILQGLMTTALTLGAIELPYPPEYSGDRKELLNFISKVYSKLAGENRCFLDDQHKPCYVYSYLNDNTQNQIQLYIQTDKISLDDVEALIKILEAAFGNPDEVVMASGELDCLMQGNYTYSIYYAEFQYLMAILHYNSKAKKATLKRGHSTELQASLTYYTNEPKDFDKFMELCIKLNCQIQAHANLSCHPNNSHLTTTKATPSPPYIMSHPTSTNSGNYGPAPIDLSTTKRSQNQHYYDEQMAKSLCLSCGLVDYFKDQCSILASNNTQKVHLAAAGISTPDVDSVPSPTSHLGKE